MSVYIQLRSHINSSARVLAPLVDQRGIGTTTTRKCRLRKEEAVYDMKTSERPARREGKNAKSEAITIPVQRLRRPKGRMLAVDYDTL